MFLSANVLQNADGNLTKAANLLEISLNTGRKEKSMD